MNSEAVRHSMSVQPFRLRFASALMLSLAVVLSKAQTGLHPTTTTAAVPQILSVSPAKGPVGQRVTVTGLNFGQGPAGGSIAFGDNPAQYDLWTDSKIIARVPYGAKSGEVTVTHGHHWNKSGPRFLVTKPSQTVLYKMTFIDTSSGLGIHHVTISGGPVTTEAPIVKVLGTTGDSHTVKLPLIAGLRYGVEIVADGYGSTRSTVAADPDGSLTWNLKPLEEAAKLQVVKAQTDLNGDYVYGYIADSKTALPLAGVRVAIPKYHVSTISDSDGFYDLHIPLPASLSDEEQVSGRLDATLPGYRHYSYFELRLSKGDGVTANISLTPGGKGSDIIRPYDGPTGTGIGLTKAELAKQAREAEEPPRKYNNLDFWLNPELRNVQQP